MTQQPETDSVTLVNFARRVRACSRASASIDAFPSALVLKNGDHSLREKTLTQHLPPSLLPSEPVIDTLTHGVHTWARRRLDSISLPGSSEPSNLLKHFVAMLSGALPFSFQCSRSALPPVICTLSSLRPRRWQLLLNVRGVTTAAPGDRRIDIAYILYLAVIMFLRWWSAHYFYTIKSNLCGN